MTGTTIIQSGNGFVAGQSRIFNITGGNVAISDVTIRHGLITSGNNGAGISNAGDLTLTNVTVRNNTAGATLGAKADGGGIYNDGGTLALNNSTVSNNTARSDGAGIFNDNGTLTLTNSTVSGNIADGAGAGIYNNGGTLTMTASTVSSNRVHLSRPGGGIFNAGTARLRNTIVAGNTGPAHPDDCKGSVTSLGHNLLGTSAGCTFTAAIGDQAGTAASPIDPQLGPLQDNGGPTFTHALLPGSVAIDTGTCNDADGSTPLTTDQRGKTRPRPQGGTCDVGAYELKTVSVTKTGDTSGSCTSASCSLREAIAAADPSRPKSLK